MASPPLRWWEKKDLARGVVLRGQMMSEFGPCTTKDALRSCGG